MSSELLKDIKATEESSSVASKSDRKELSSETMRAILLELLTSLSQLSLVMTETKAQRTHNTSDISQKLADLAQKALDEITKQTDEMQAKQKDQGDLGTVIEVFSDILFALTEIFALCTGNLVLFAVTLFTFVAEKSGAFQALSEAISKACGDNKALAFFVELAVVLAISIVCAQATSIFQRAFGTAATAAAEAIGTAASATAAAAEDSIAQTLKQVLKQIFQVIKKILGTTTTHGSLAFFQVLGAASSMCANDFGQFMVQLFHKNETDEEKKKAESDAELAFTILSIVFSIAGGIFSYCSAENIEISVQKIFKFFGKIKDFATKLPTVMEKIFRFLGSPAFMLLSNGLATAGESAGAIGKGIVSIQLADNIKNLAYASADQELISQLRSFAAQMFHKEQDEDKNISDQIANFLKNQITSKTDPDRAMAEILSEMAV